MRVDTASDVNMAIERESYVISTLSARTAKLPPTQRTTHATANPETWRAGNVLIPGKAVSAACSLYAHGTCQPSANVGSKNTLGQNDASRDVTVA